MLDTSTTVSPIRARFAIQDRQWARAATIPDLDQWAAFYVVRVLAPDTALERLTGTERRQLALGHAKCFSSAYPRELDSAHAGSMHQ